MSAVALLRKAPRCTQHHVVSQGRWCTAKTRGDSLRRLYSSAPSSWPVPERYQQLALETRAPIELAKALHPSFYTDQEYAQHETDHIFGSQWFAIAHTAELSSGDVKVVQISSKSVFLTRDSKGQLHAYYAATRVVCSHNFRAQSSVSENLLVALDRQTAEVLGYTAVPAIEVFAGMVFINFKPHASPLSDALGDLPSKLSRYDLDYSTLHGKKHYGISGNWKLAAENFVDFFHINAVHPELAKFSQVDDHLPYQGKGQYIGFATSPLTDIGGPPDRSHFNPFPRLLPDELSGALFFHIFPNVSVTLYPHSMYTLITLPSETPGNTQQQLTLLMAPNARKHVDDNHHFHSKCDDLMRFVTRINDEDTQAVEALQSGLANAAGNGLTGKFVPQFDWPIHRFQNLLISSFDDTMLNDGIMPQLFNDFEQKLMASMI